MIGPVSYNTLATSLIGVGVLIVALAMFADVIWR